VESHRIESGSDRGDERPPATNGRLEWGTAESNRPTTGQLWCTMLLRRMTQWCWMQAGSLRLSPLSLSLSLSLTTASHLSMSAPPSTSNAAAGAHAHSSTSINGVGMQIRTLATSELQLVLSYLTEKDLPRVARVSSVWYRAVDSPVAWKHLVSGALAGRCSVLGGSDLASSDVFTRTSVNTWPMSSQGLSVKNPFVSGLVRRRMPMSISLNTVARSAITEADMQNIIEHLEQLGCIVQVLLQACAFTKEQKHRICAVDALQSIRKLSIGFQVPETDAICLVSLYPHLTELLYDNPAQLDETFFEHAAPSLRTISIRSIFCAFEATSWKILARLPHLTSLSMEEYVLYTAAFSLASLTPAESFPSLLLLHIRVPPPVQHQREAEKFRSLATVLPTMHHLRVISFEVVNQDVRRFALALECLAGLPSDALPCLQHLVLDAPQGTAREVRSQLLTHLPLLLENRPVARFTAHLRIVPNVRPSSQTFETPLAPLCLPCLISYPLAAAEPVDEAELVRLDEIVRNQTPMTKAEMLVIIAEERAKTAAAASPAADAEESAKRQQQATGNLFGSK
jgi:hypothetical protein